MATLAGGSVTVIVPSGEDAVVNITKASGASFTAYSDAFGASSLTLPTTVTSGATTVYLPDAEDYVVSVKINGQERATSTGSTRSVSPRNGANLTFSVEAGPAAGGIVGGFTSGHYYIATTPGGSSTSAVLGVGTLRVTPVYIPTAVTITKLGAEVTSAGEAGSKVRLGIYADNGNGYPGSLLLDAGTINGDSATVQEITVSQALTPGLYWFGGAVQVVSTTQPTVRTQGSVPNVPLAFTFGSTIPGAGASICGYTQTGVTGAFPSTFTTTVNVATTHPRLFFKVA